MGFKSILIFFLFLSYFAHGQTAVYYCAETGAVGYCYDEINAEECAYQACIFYNGKSPELFFYTSEYGYGAFAIGTNKDGQRAIGVAAGMKTQGEAQRKARLQCFLSGGLDIYIFDSWYDDENNY